MLDLGTFPRCLVDVEDYVSRPDKISVAEAVVLKGEFGVLGPDDDCWSQMAGRIHFADEGKSPLVQTLSLKPRHVLIMLQHSQSENLRFYYFILHSVQQKPDVTITSADSDTDIDESDDESVETITLGDRRIGMKTSDLEDLSDHDN
ncbi:hypothetical protein SSX86_030146 [Deinandra increscens subsp. villosa]|uniref:Uncharacterized protein n=1 Tax=Deinandra increscens subsp. villosa TaxID=3103831 RepID=A0AAP0C8W6_9ASTR